MGTKTGKARLGKGLGSLLTDAAITKSRISNEDIERSTGVFMVDVEKIDPNPFQPRKDFDEKTLTELGHSLKNHGLIQPITVRKATDGRYQIISGERRWRAARNVSLKEIPAYIREADNTAMLEMAIVENLQRENLNAIEIAIHFQRMIDECDLKQEQLAERVNKNRSTVTNYLRLLKLPPEIQVSLRDGYLSMGHARAIINIENLEEQLYIHKQIVEKHLSVREVEKWVQTKGNKNSKQPHSESTEHPESVYFSRLETDLMHKFGTKVELKVSRKNKGKIVIPFYSSDDLDRILELLN